MASRSRKIKGVVIEGLGPGSGAQRTSGRKRKARDPEMDMDHDMMVDVSTELPPDDQPPTQGVFDPDFWYGRADWLDRMRLDASRNKLSEDQATEFQDLEVSGGPFGMSFPSDTVSSATPAFKVHRRTP